MTPGRRLQIDCFTKSCCSNRYCCSHRVFMQADVAAQRPPFRQLTNNAGLSPPIRQQPTGTSEALQPTHTSQPLSRERVTPTPTPSPVLSSSTDMPYSPSMRSANTDLSAWLSTPCCQRLGPQPLGTAVCSCGSCSTAPQHLVLNCSVPFMMPCARANATTVTTAYQTLKCDSRPPIASACWHSICTT